MSAPTKLLTRVFVGKIFITKDLPHCAKPNSNLIILRDLPGWAGANLVCTYLFVGCCFAAAAAAAAAVSLLESVVRDDTAQQQRCLTKLLE